VIYDAESTSLTDTNANTDMPIETLLLPRPPARTASSWRYPTEGPLPHEVEEIIAGEDRSSERFRIHAHNDADWLVANTTGGGQARRGDVHGTVNGYGERCGNANLSPSSPISRLKMGIDCRERPRASRSFANCLVTSMNWPTFRTGSGAFVGTAAFATRAAYTWTAVAKIPRT